MTPRQQIAYADPCVRAHDCMQPKFSKREAVTGQNLSVTITVNK